MYFTNFHEETFKKMAKVDMFLRDYFLEETLISFYKCQMIDSEQNVM